MLNPPFPSHTYRIRRSLHKAAAACLTSNRRRRARSSPRKRGAARLRRVTYSVRTPANQADSSARCFLLGITLSRSTLSSLLAGSGCTAGSRGVQRDRASIQGVIECET
jgi:hypothetical protein